MGTKQVHQLWDRCDGLDVTSTETLVLFALASAQSDVTGCCHPLQEKLAAKTHLSPSCVKEALASLKAKGLVSWRVKPAHVNEYKLTFLPAATGGGVEERVGNDKQDLPTSKRDTEATQSKIPDSVNFA